MSPLNRVRTLQVFCGSLLLWLGTFSLPTTKEETWEAGNVHYQNHCGGLLSYYISRKEGAMSAFSSFDVARAQQMDSAANVREYIKDGCPAGSLMASNDMTFYMGLVRHGSPA